MSNELIYSCYILRTLTLMMMRAPFMHMFNFCEWSNFVKFIISLLETMRNITSDVAVAAVILNSN